MSDIRKFKRLFLSLAFICLSFIIFRPFIVSQLVRRAEGYIGFNMHKDAAREYRKALILSPNNSKTMNWLGYVYRNMGDLDRAIFVYEKAVKLNPQDIIAYHDLGAIYVGRAQFELAKKYFFKASSIPLGPKEDMGEDLYFYHNASLEMLSICQERLGEIEEAIETNKRILKYYPENKLARERIERLSEMKKSRK